MSLAFIIGTLAVTTVWSLVASRRQARDKPQGLPAPGDEGREQTPVR
jgi:hypothetical protein